MRHPAGWAPPTTSRQSRPDFKLTISTPTGAPHAPYLRRHLRRARALTSGPLDALHVILVGNQQMSRLHERFMGIEGPTDVITFPIDSDARGRPVSGEVYICVPYARQRARELGIDVRNELLLYALHGMLHLCGYDDRTHADFQKMHLKEDQILRHLKIGNVFAHRPATRRSARGTRSVGSLAARKRTASPRRAP